MTVMAARWTFSGGKQCVVSRSMRMLKPGGSWGFGEVVLDCLG